MGSDNTFPLWKDPNCPHDPRRQMRDGMGYVCLDCGVIRLIWSGGATRKIEISETTVTRREQESVAARLRTTRAQGLDAG